MGAAAGGVVSDVAIEQPEPAAARSELPPSCRVGGEVADAKLQATAAVVGELIADAGEASSQLDAGSSCIRHGPSAADVVVVGLVRASAAAALLIGSDVLQVELAGERPTAELTALVGAPNAGMALECCSATEAEAAVAVGLFGLSESSSSSSASSLSSLGTPSRLSASVNISVDGHAAVSSAFFAPPSPLEAVAAPSFVGEAPRVGLGLAPLLDARRWAAVRRRRERL